MLTRRDFLKIGMSVSGIAITIRYFPVLKLAQVATDSSHNFGHDDIHDYNKDSWNGGPGFAKHRYEGVAKVTGAKIYARDFCTRDFPEWPQQEARVVLIKATRIDRIYNDIILNALPKNARPYKIIFAKDLHHAQIQCPSFFNTKLLLDKGEVPEYLGQGLALLYFQGSEFAEAVSTLNNPEALISYGSPAKPSDRPLYCSEKFVKYKKGQSILFSAAHDGVVDFTKSSEFSQNLERMQHYSQLIAQELSKEKWKVISRTYKTQSVDPAFMEPENGLCWYDKNHHLLRIVAGSQSPYADAEHIAALFTKKGCKIKVKTVDINACYPGGGFGGKEHSIFPVYLALAGVFSDGRSVRLVNSRCDQFQFGLKRHAAEMHETLAIDEAGHFQVLKAQFIFDGGGYNNFSWCVPVVAADNAASGSYFPKVDITYRANASGAIPAGSMRGFGASQAQFAIESLIDEAAEQLKIDPIELRLKNYFDSSYETIRGRVPTRSFQVKAVLEKARSHFLWKNREKFKVSSPAGFATGVGFAVGVKSFGTTRDAALAEVTIEKDGTISLVSNYLDMGNGVATTLPLACAKYLGSNASRIQLGATHEFKILGLFSEFCTDQAQLDRNAKNPRFTPEVMMSAAASAGAYQHRHVVLQAARLLFQESIIPAAKILWGKEDIEVDKIKWHATQLVYPHLPSLALPHLAKAIYSQKRIVATMVHGYYQAGWSQAKFNLNNRNIVLPVDGLAVKYPESQYEVLNRSSVEFPPVSNSWGGEDLFTPCGALCKLTIELATGEVKVKEMHTFLDCGPITHRQIVEGQVYGAVAMGIGQTLFEQFPQFEEGPGSGGWNFHRYKVPLSQDVPLTLQEIHFIDPLSPDDDPKGMAEVVLNPIAPAIANAIAHATGKRFRELPILPQQIKGALS